MKRRIENEEKIECCAECHEPTVQLRSGDEGWTYCEGCRLTEGDTVYLSNEFYVPEASTTPPDWLAASQAANHAVMVETFGKIFGGQK